MKLFSRPAAPAVPASGHDVHVGDGHEHTHGEGCGHPVLPHEGHVDYLHDGHRHTPHGVHYDECGDDT